MVDWIERVPPWVWMAFVVHGVVLGTVAYLILLERKVASWVQDRIGPNRVGPGGLLQPLADGMKFIFKEDYRPRNVDRILFSVAPAVMIIVVIISIAVIPWGGVKQSSRDFDVTGVSDVRAAVQNRLPWGVEIVGEPQVTTAKSVNALGETVGTTIARVTYRWPFQIANISIGVLFIIAALSLAVYGVVVGGWASNNKYSFLGGLRATANMISYEIPLGLAVLTLVVLFGTLDLGEIVTRQAHYWGFTVGGHHYDVLPAWNVFSQPLAFLLFLVCIHAEANRSPFDLAEAEQELVGGYHTEYSSMRFALFFLAEYAGMVTTSALCVALFFGGWHLPWIEWLWPALGGDVTRTDVALTTSMAACIVRAMVFFTKTLAILFVFMWVRWSLPRFRFDQLMMTAWRALIPMSLALLVAVALVVYGYGANDSQYVAGRIVSGWFGLILLGCNVAVLVLTMIVSKIVRAAPATNRKIKVVGSRFENTPLSPLATNN